MNVTRLQKQFGSFIVAALILNGAASTRVSADGQHGNAKHTTTAPGADSLIGVARQAAERFKNVEVAKAEGYAPMFGCVSGEDKGAMGIHYVNMSLVGDPEIDATKPEIVIYEPMPDGSLKLIGADYLVLANAWDTNPKNKGTPQLMGQLFHLFAAPNRYGLPAFYTLHVWAFKENPTGAFVNWHSNVSCASAGGQ